MRSKRKRARYPAPKMSRERRQQAREAIQQFNRMRRFRPRCGARRKTDGEPCQQMALANGKCHWHGGSTPRGDRWHRPAWLDGKGPKAAIKANRKLRNDERARKKRAALLAEMTPEEHAAHKRWQATHKPGPPGARAAERKRRKQNQWVRKFLAEKEIERRPAKLETTGAGEAKSSAAESRFDFDLFE